MTRESVVVVAPGRGTYNATELGYLGVHHGRHQPLIRAVDAYREQHGQVAVTQLDAAQRFSPSQHGIGSNAAGLIYAAALADFQAINRERFDIVAVTGNSMGWYLALAAAGVTEAAAGGIELVEEMARLMDELGTGGQLVYPLVDEQWRRSQQHEAALARVFADAAVGELFTSIRLGGSLVLAGTESALQQAQAELPKVNDRFPLRLARHAAFHTPLLAHVSERAFDTLSEDLFSAGETALIDGRGEIWAPGSDPVAIRQYTLGHQVVARYDFTRAIEVAVREFAPDRLIVLGPGTAMGAPVLQTLAMMNWLGLNDREGWQQRQQCDPYVLGMGLASQRGLVTAGEDAAASLN